MIARQGPTAAVSPRSGIRRHGDDRRRGLLHLFFRLNQRCSEARLVVRLGGIPSGAEITYCIGICGSSDVVSCGERISCAAE